MHGLDPPSMSQVMALGPTRISPALQAQIRPHAAFVVSYGPMRASVASHAHLHPWPMYWADLARGQFGLTPGTYIATIGACARAQPPRAVQGLDSHTLRAAGGWMGGPRCRTDEGCVRRLTHRSERCAVSRQKSLLPHLVGFASEERGIVGRPSTYQGCYSGPSGRAGKVLVPPRPRI